MIGITKTSGFVLIKDLLKRVVHWIADNGWDSIAGHAQILNEEEERGEVCRLIFQGDIIARKPSPHDWNFVRIYSPTVDSLTKNSNICLCCYLKQAFEQAVELPAISNEMTLMWGYCNGVSITGN